MPYGVEVLSTLLSKSEGLGSSPSGATNEILYWGVVYGARLDSKSRLPSEGGRVGSIPTTPTKITKLLVCLILKNYMKK